MSALCGIWGKPYLDLSPFVNVEALPALAEEIPYALSQVEPAFTGGSLKWMGVTAPWVRDDPFLDYGHVIAGFSREEFERFVSLAAEPGVFDLDRQKEYTFGDETDHPLTLAQMRWLEYRHGVYFPWKVCYHLVENDRWEDKHSGEGKDFGEEARELFPKTVAYLEALPFREIGRAVLFGVLANDHAPAHRDSEPGKTLQIAQSISIDPSGNKRFYVCDPQHGSHTRVEAPVYWFNDMDYHGVEPAPFFQYSIRVDGTFEPEFLRELERAARS
jgi:hypothetical protein